MSAESLFDDLDLLGTRPRLVPGRLASCPSPAGRRSRSPRCWVVRVRPTSRSP
ncbi:hypothetical protein NKG05_03860 [Oerskovia sp. M15]